MFLRVVGRRKDILGVGLLKVNEGYKVGGSFRWIIRLVIPDSSLLDPVGFLRYRGVLV